MIKNIFALIGFVVTILAIAGSFGVGSFTLIYGPEKVNCIEIKDEAKK